MVLKDVFPMVIRDQAACCVDVGGLDAYIGVTVFHPDPEDGTSHALDLYWRDAPEGRQVIDRPSSLKRARTGEGLGHLSCPCGWEGIL